MHFSGKILIPKVGRAEVKLVFLYNSEKQYKIIVQLLDSILAKVWKTNTETLWPR